MATLQAELVLQKRDQDLRQRVLVRRQLGDLALNATLQVYKESYDDLFLRLEIVVNCAFAHIGCVRNLFNSQIVEASVSHEMDGRAQ
jgi:hypothetical protein